jgi:hypothetical protein
MLVRVAVIADYASLSVMDKLNVMGIFSVIFVPILPYAHPQMQLVCQIEFESDEVGQKSLRIALFDADDRELFGIDGAMNIPRAPDGQKTTVNQILCLNNVRFENYGPHEFRVFLNSDVVAIIPVRVMKPLPRPSIASPSNN